MSSELRHIMPLVRWEACRRAADYRVGQKRNHVAWLIKRDSWYTVRQLSVTVYAEGCIRFRNDTAWDIPKRVWTLPQPQPDAIGKMEITVHESEVEALLPLILEIAEDAKRDYRSELFANGIVSPSYCWTAKATAHYDRRHKRTPKPIRMP